MKFNNKTFSNSTRRSTSHKSHIKLRIILIKYTNLIRIHNKNIINRINILLPIFVNHSLITNHKTINIIDKLPKDEQPEAVQRLRAIWQAKDERTARKRASKLIADFQESDPGVKFEDIPGIGKKTISVLKEAGFDTLEKLNKTNNGELASLKGIGEKTAEKIIAICKTAKKEKQNEEGEKSDIFSGIANSLEESEKKVDPDIFQQKIEEASMEDQNEEGKAD